MFGVDRCIVDCQKKKKWRLVNFKGISILVDPSHEKYDWYSTLLTSILVCMPKYI